ncbi:MAG: hypothetical protein KKA75_00505 [Proteobacteria bacterium]|nr:hypothetical protein [Pseudomonadota bacterium]
MIEIFHWHKSAAILALCVLLIIGCSFLSVVFTSIPMSLSDVGEIKFGQPITEGELTRIPFSLQGDKWNVDSARVLIEVNATRHEHKHEDVYEIFFTLITCLASEGVKKVEPEIRLKGLKPGRYMLIYQNPDKVSIMLGEIEI